MNDNEIDRIAAATNALRPDWPTASIRTLLATKLTNRTRRDAAVALAWVACESDSKTPARVLEHGPWWQAAAVEAPTTGHQHVAKVYGSTEGDPREICGICSQLRDECTKRAATNGHEFRSRADCPPRPNPSTDWMRRRTAAPEFDPDAPVDGMTDDHKGAPEPDDRKASA